MVPIEKPILTHVWEQANSVIRENASVPALRLFEPWLHLCELEHSWQQPKGVLDYREVAEASIFSYLTGHKEALDFFKNGVSTLLNRQYFLSGQALGLEQDPIALIALALGMDEVPEAREWLVTLLENSLSFFGSSDSKEPLLQLALFLSKCCDSSKVSLHPILEVALSKLGLTEPDDETRHQAFKLVLNPTPPEPEWAPFQASALQEILASERNSIDLGKPTLEDLSSLLKNVPAALMRWLYIPGEPDR